MKIKELKIGAMCTIPLVVRSAVAKKTKSQRSYLTLEFFDGFDTITGNYWDWVSGNIPEVNTVLDVKAQVTEWQGAKQLTVKGMTVCTTMRLADFMPNSAFNIEQVYTSACELLSTVTDETLRVLSLALMQELRESWLLVPGAVSVHHNYVGGTLVHSYNVALKAKALAEITEGANVDLAIVGGLLHDLGKLYTYRFNGVNIELTTNGKLYEHIFMGAEFLGNFAETHVDMDNPYVYGKVRLLRHIILSHHGSLEFGSPVTPQCVEAYIVHYADALDAAVEQLRVASEKAPNGTNWTDRVWTLNNRAHLTMNYTAELMSGKTKK